MTTLLSNEPLSTPHKAGVFKSIWRAVVAFDRALDFDPMEDLERRVRNLESRLPDRDQHAATAIERGKMPGAAA